jgi:transposase-like protein
MSKLDIIKEISKRKYIYCPLCGHKLPLLKTGKLRKHARQPGYECKASGFTLILV